MKTLAACLILLSSAFYAQTGECQLKPNAAAGLGVRDTTTKRLYVAKTVAASRVRNGSVLLHSQTGKYRLYAALKNGRVVDYTATNFRGQKLKTTVSGTVAKTHCMVCVIGDDGKQVCWLIDCKDLPRPPSVKATLRQ